MTQATILGSDTVKDALKTKTNANDTELYEAVAALAAGSGVVISANDATVGYLNGKLVAGSNVTLTEGNDGGDETLSVAAATELSGDTTPQLGGNLDLNGNTIPGLLGLQTIFIPAGALTSRTTNGAASGSVETSTNKIMLESMDFDNAIDEFVQFSVRMPKSWNAGTVSAKFIWSHPSTTTNFGVRFFIQGVAFADGDTADTAFGTAAGHPADTGGTTDDIYITSSTDAVTISNTPAKSDYVIFQVYRDVSDAGDTLAVDARLHGVVLFYITDAHTDA